MRHRHITMHRMKSVVHDVRPGHHLCSRGVRGRALGRGRSRHGGGPGQTTYSSFDEVRLSINEMIARRRFVPILVVTILLGVELPARAELVTSDFNGMTTGSALSGQSSGSTGLRESWVGATAPVVRPTNLTSSNYNVTQTGVAGRIQSQTGVNGAESTTRRGITTPLSGTVWFTFLGQLTDSDDRVALTLNQINSNNVDNNATDNNDLNLIFVGSGSGGLFRVRIKNDPNMNDNVVTGLSQNNTTTYLILAQLAIDSGGVNDALNVWFDPDLTAITGPEDLPAPNFSNSSYDFVNGSTISNLGVSSYTSDISGGSPDGGILDNIRISDTTDAFYEVTGVVIVPEPSPLVLLPTALALGSVCARRRKASST